MACILIGCNKDDEDIIPSVFMEHVLKSSGDKAELTGRILSVSELTASDHGFELSTDESFSNITKLSLGTKDRPGRFVGSASGLSIKTKYFVRAYMDIGNGIEYSNVLSFNTVGPAVRDFEPKQGNPNTVITVEGANFTDNTYILWNGTNITPSSITNESFLQFSVPAITDATSVNFEVVSQEETLTFDRPFEYTLGTWNDLGQLMDVSRNNRHIYFSDSEYFFYGTGVTSEFNGIHGNIYRLNKNNLERTLISNAVVPVEGSFFTPSGYFGGGSTGLVTNGNTTLSLSSNFYKWENNAASQLQSIPKPLYRSCAVEVNGDVYVLGGEDASREHNLDIWKYDSSNNTWQVVGQSPYAPFSFHPYFAMGDEIFVIDDQGNMKAFNTSSNEWTDKAKYPDVVLKDGENVVLGDKVYVGLQDNNRKLYEYIPAEDRWLNLKSFNAFTQPTTSQGAYTNGENIYFMRANFGNGEMRYLWEFNPKGY